MDNGLIRCEGCNGTGTIPVDVGIGNWNTGECPECAGAGYFHKDTGKPAFESDDCEHTGKEKA